MIHKHPMKIDAAFLLHVYQDWDLAKRLIIQIRQFHPSVQTIAITDGTHNDDFQDLCDCLDIDYRRGDRLKLHPSGGAWLERMFQTFLVASDAGYLIKLDPDSYFHRPIASIPDADWFGTLKERVPPLVYGGAIGFSRSAAQQVLNSHLLRASRYHDVGYSYQRYGRSLAWEWEEVSEEAIACTDLIIADVCYRLRLNPVHWNECLCNHRLTPNNPGLKHAITHPHPNPLS